MADKVTGTDQQALVDIEDFWLSVTQSQLQGCVLAKYHWPFGQQLLLPLADQIGMDVVLAGDFIERFQPLSRFQRDFELKLITITFSFFGHSNSSTSFLDKICIHLSANTFVMSVDAVAGLQTAPRFIQQNIFVCT